MSAQHRGAARAGLCSSYFGFGSTAAWGLFAEADQVQAIFKRHRKRSIRDGTIHRKVRLWRWWRWWSSSLLLENSSINLRWGGWAEWGHRGQGSGVSFQTRKLCRNITNIRHRAARRHHSLPYPARRVKPTQNYTFCVMIFLKICKRTAETKVDVWLYGFINKGPDIFKYDLNLWLNVDSLALVSLKA